jgi:hypothetical protein
MEKAKEIIMWVIALLIGAAVIAPCLLTFSEGLNGEPTVWNLIGLAYTAFLVWVVTFLKKRKNAQHKN